MIVTDSFLLYSRNQQFKYFLVPVSFNIHQWNSSTHNLKCEGQMLLILRRDKSSFSTVLWTSFMILPNTIHLFLQVKNPHQFPSWKIFHSSHPPCDYSQYSSMSSNFCCHRGTSTCAIKNSYEETSNEIGMFFHSLALF